MLKSEIKIKYGRSEISITENEYAEQEAKIAIEMIVKWGCVAAEPDGEDSSGRQKMKMMSEKTLVKRAFKAAKLAMDYARANGLIHTCPDKLEEEEGEA